MRNTEKEEGKVKKKSIRKSRLFRLLLPLLFFMILVMLALFVTGLIPVDEVQVKGNEISSKDSIIYSVFPENEEVTLFLVLKDRYLGTEVPASFTSLKVDAVSAQACMIQVREKEKIAALHTEDRYLILVEKGYMLGASSNDEGLPIVEGLSVLSYEDFQVPVCEEGTEKLLAAVMISEALNEYRIRDVKVCWEEDSFVLEMGDLKANLGDTENIREKISTLKNQLDSLEGLKGILYLENYQPDASNRFYFEVEP